MRIIRRVVTFACYCFHIGFSIESSDAGVMSPTKFVASDFQALGKYNVNLIRWQIMRNWGQTDTERDLTDYNDWLAGKLNELDSVLLAAKENGLKVVIDLHTPPGGRYSDHSMAMFYEKVYNDRFIEIWREIATRYNGNPTVWAYDLVNEPTQNKTDPPAGMSSKETQTNRESHKSDRFNNPRYHRTALHSQVRNAGGLV
jgi:aryl-phospho-beta-D-glucosidase BglC (GH1 family)